MNSVAERAILIPHCTGPLLGILHPVEKPTGPAVIIIVGGPQYRVGAHRSFVIWARSMAKQGIPVMRFDLPGMGDSPGEPMAFDQADTAIEAALETLYKEQSDIEHVALMGLCDAASAAMIYAPNDPRVRRLILMNPWVRSASGQAKALVKHYYMRRFLTRQFWGKLLRGGVGIGAVVEFSRNLKKGREKPTQKSRNFVQRMREGWHTFEGQSLVILSGNDLTAKEFTDRCQTDSAWSNVISRSSVTVQNLDAADHTFSRAEWRDQVADWSSQWLRQQ